MKLALANLASSALMTGMIWTIQTVHYPLFRRVGDAEFPAYMAEHQSRISALILIPWAAEGLTSLALAADPPSGVPRWLALAGLAAAGVPVLATVGLSIPAHDVLSDGLDEAAIRRLVDTNWVRTAAWSAHTAIAAVILARATSGQAQSLS